MIYNKTQKENSGALRCHLLFWLYTKAQNGIAILCFGITSHLINVVFFAKSWEADSASSGLANKYPCP